MRKRRGRQLGPLRRVLSWGQNEHGLDVEILECGHTVPRRQDIYGPTNAVRRRCRRCRKAEEGHVPGSAERDMSELIDVHDVGIERPCCDPWGRIPHFVTSGATDRGVLYVPARNGQWSGVGCTLEQAREAVQAVVNDRLVERRVTLRCTPTGKLNGVDVEWSWDPALQAAHAYEDNGWWREEPRPKALCGETIGEPRPPGHDDQGLQLEACGACVRVLSLTQAKRR